METLGSFYLTVYRGKIHCPRWVLGLLNTIRRFLWLPVMAVGVYSWLQYYYDYNGLAYLVGSILGIILGGVCHEISHAISCVYRGGRFHEAGICLMYFVFPGMYVMTEVPRKRMYAFEMLVAGVEGNLFLCGVLLILSAHCRQGGPVLEAMALTNCTMGILNLLPMTGVDGMSALSCILGSASEEIVPRAIDVIASRKKRHRLQARGYHMELAACWMLTATQMMVPLLWLCLVISGIWEVVLLCISSL